MNVTVTVPESVVLEGQFEKVMAEGIHGNFCVLPRHIDYLAPLCPGILVLANEEKRQFLATDTGLLIKQGSQVLIAVQRAIESDGIENLTAEVSKRFGRIRELERTGMTATARLEATFVRRLFDVWSNE